MSFPAAHGLPHSRFYPPRTFPNLPLQDALLTEGSPRLRHLAELVTELAKPERPARLKGSFEGYALPHEGDTVSGTTLTDTTGGEAASLTAGRKLDEHNEADCSMDHGRNSLRRRESRSNDRRYWPGDRRHPANARATGGCKLVPDQRNERGRLATTRCIARGGGSTTSRTMRVPSARGRVTCPPRSSAIAS